MNSAQIENNLQQVVKSFNKDTFIYDMLLAYDIPKASVTRLQKGGLNLSKVKGEIAWKKKLFFKVIIKEDLHELIEDLKTDVKATKHDPRFIIVTDFKTLLAIDRKTTDTLDIPILEIPRHYDFFLPWAGMEKSKDKSENPADLKAAILQDDTMLRAMPGNVDPEVINKVLIPKIIQIKYPELTEAEVEEIRQYVVVDSVIKSGEIKEVGDKRFIRMAGQFVNIDDLHIDLIDKINPFQKAFEILSKSVTTKVLKVIQDVIESTRIIITLEEAMYLWPKINDFVKTFKKEPSLQSTDPLERRMSEAIIYLKEQKRKTQTQNG